MNLRCIYCQTPFTLSRSEMLGAIINMNEKNQNHYDAHCPRCRRANSISRQRMELFFPNWREAAKQQAAEPVTPPTPVSPPQAASTSLKTEPLSKSKKAQARKAAARKSPAAASKKPAARKTTSTKTTTAKKTAPKSKKK